MSDTPQGPGWWQASDGKWYPPEQAPGGPPPSSRPTSGPADQPQGPGWWQASDGKWYAPHQAPGGSPPGAAAPGWTGPPGAVPYAAPGEVAVSGPPGFEPVDAIRYGWAKFKDQPGPIVIAMLINFAVGAAISGVTYAVVGTDSPAAFGFDDLGPRIIIQLVNFLVGSIIQMAIIRAGLGIARGERVELGDMFRTDQLGTYLLASLLFSIVTVIGLVLCVVPGLAAILFFHLFGIFILDRKLGVIDSFRASAQLVQTDIGRFIVFLLLSVLVAIAGVLACFVGLLVAIPVITIAQTYVYFRAQGQSVAP